MVSAPEKKVAPSAGFSFSAAMQYQNDPNLTTKDKENEST